MKRIVKNISDYLLSRKKEDKDFELKRSLKSGYQVKISYIVGNNIKKTFSGIVVKVRRMNSINALVHVLNSDSDVRVKQAFSIYSRNIEVVNVIPTRILRKANSGYLMHVNSIKKSLCV